METTHNEAAVLRAVQDIVIETVPVPEPEEDEVLLKMGSVGVCGSDIKFWKKGFAGKFTLKAPMIIGHEGSGTVVKVGSKVKSLKIGDRVSIEPGTPCRRCQLCKSGRYNLCPDVTFCATPPVNGNICRYYKHAEDFCFKIPDHMTLDEAALVEPLSVALYACRRGQVILGSNVLVSGAGPVGILTMMAAKAAGAIQVLNTDISDNRLKMATTLGSDHVVNVTGRDILEVAKDIEKILGCQPDVTIECSSTDYGFELGLHATKPGGTLVVVGRPTRQAVLPIGVAFSKEVDIKSVFRYTNCYPPAIKMIASGMIDVKRLITHHFPLRETLRAFETFSSPDSNAVKVIVNCEQ